MRSVPPKILRELRDIVHDWAKLTLNEVDPDTLRLYDAIDRALAPKRAAKPARQRRQAKKTERQAEWAEIRAAVLKRSLGACEHHNPGFTAPEETPVFESLDVDHAFGRGAGKKSLESVSTCWALCRSCHHEKTNNRPAPPYWLQCFVSHCHRHYGDADGDEYRKAASMALDKINAKLARQKAARP